jgi:fumarate reductase flavoprotein subunit
MLEVSRRSFFKGSATAAGVAALGGAVGQASVALADETPEQEYEISGTYTCDFCIVGVGYAGLAAAAQALENGLSVVGFEQTGYPASGAYNVEGCFSVGAADQIAAGHDVKPVEFVGLEMEYSHNRANGVKWMDLVHNTGADVDWLQEHGCQFPEVQRSQMFYSDDRALWGYVKPMVKFVEENGAKILTNTTAVQMLTNEDGSIRGVIGRKATGEYVQVNAPCVLLSTGGFSSNNDYLREAGFQTPEDVVRFIPGFNGDGITLARQVGGADILHKCTALQQPTVTGAPGGEYGTYGNGNPLVACSRSQNNLWVNEAGARICAENSGDVNWMALMIPMLVHKKVYSIYDRKAFELNFYGGPTAYDRTTSWQYDDEACLAQFDDHFDNCPYGDCVKADTIEELAQKAGEMFEGMDADALLETINHYNEMCAAGEDEDFGKPAEYMQEFATGPFYMIYLPLSVMVTYGALNTSRNYEVVDDTGTPIPGLYAAGNDGCDLWPNIYTINVQCGTSACHIFAGRTSANAALKYLGDRVTGTIEEEGDTSPCVIVRTYEMPAELADGVYVSDPQPGMFCDITATVTVEDGKIVAIEQENEMETGRVGGYAMDEIIEKVIETNDIQMDVVAGATGSSNGLLRAIENALQQAAK